MATDPAPVASSGAASASAGATPALSVRLLAAELCERLGEPAASRAHEVIAALLDVPRFWPAMHQDDAVPADVCAAARAAAARLLGGAPFAYAVGRAPFRHLTLDVDERVLIPRPETEQLVEEVLRATAGCTGIVADVGTGSGAIALSLASEGRFARVIATDVSLDALAVARGNADRMRGALRSEMDFRHGSLLAPLTGERLDVLVSNPPYVAHSEAAELPPMVRDWEPPVALFSGSDGMAATAALVRGAAGVLQPGALLALEVDCRRAAIAAELLAVRACFEDVAVRLDLAGRERFVLARRAGGR